MTRPRWPRSYHTLTTSGGALATRAGRALSWARLSPSILATRSWTPSSSPVCSSPGHWLQGKEGEIRRFGPLRAAAYFAIGLYAGLVVLGSGFFMLAALVLLTGYDLRHGNAMKAFILLVVGLQSLFVFAESNEVNWSAGVPLALGSAVEAYVAARAVTIGVGVPLPRAGSRPVDRAVADSQQRKIPAARLREARLSSPDKYPPRIPLPVVTYLI